MQGGPHRLRHLRIVSVHDGSRPRVVAGATAGRLPPVQTILAASPAFTKTFGLLVVFIGIGVVVNAIIVFIGVQIHGEREQNRRDRQS
jgi:hypothetical protein